jgi:O-antigen/teichoic acid export membrane protein
MIKSTLKQVQLIRLMILALLTHEGVKKYFNNTSWLFLEQILRVLSGLLVGVVVAKYLGPTEFGVYSYVIAFVSILAPVAKLGLDMVLVRELVQHPHMTEDYLGTAFWLKFVGAIFTFLAILFLLKFTSNADNVNLYILIIASGLLFQSFEVIDFYFQSKVLAKFVSSCKIVQLVISSLVRIYLVIINADLYYFVIFTLIDQVILAFFLFTAFWVKARLFFYCKLNIVLVKKLLRDGWPMIFSSLAVVFYMRIDQIMINAMLDAKEVGIFSAAVRISEFWYFIPVVVASSIYPAIINAKKISNNLYYERLQTFYLVMAWSAIFVALFMTLSASFFINVLFGASYNEAVQVLVVHTWAGVFVSLGVASGSWYATENLQRFVLYRTLSGALINVLLNLYLIPKYGIIGAAFATVISQAMASFLLDGVSKHTRIVFFMKLKALCFLNFNYIRRFKNRDCRQ